ncbi:unnamed protein product [Strongylus vulgaris]|uniref:Uncharacterized protein n=1 Tax=Strongylus vulgaris TaxID=40348 RepID=A0A3P7K8T8_STRVU|nr:unnamed protein product [Strongylus vulgaris]
MRLLILLINTLLTFAYKCTIRPYEAKGPKQTGNNGYAIEIDAATTRSDNGSTGFIPGETYKIKGLDRAEKQKVLRKLSQTFEEREKGKERAVVRGRGDARTSPGCRRGGVSHSNLRPKTSIHTIWKAPDVRNLKN